MRRKVGDPKIDTALEPLWTGFERVGRNQLLNGVYLSGILLAGVAKRFVHGLGRGWRGWLLVDTSGTDVVRRTNLTTTNKQEELWLVSAADAEVTIYVF